MDIIVCVKQVVDLQQVRIKAETREPVLEGLPLVLGDLEKNALEEAVRIKEKHGGKIIALSLGSAKLKETIKGALAMGADEAVILTDPLFMSPDPAVTAKVLAKAVAKIGSYDLILLGEGSADDYTGQVGPRLAEMLELPQVTYVRQLELTDGKIKAMRSMEEANEIVEADLPVLVTVNAEINEPRIPSLPQILKAAKKPIQEWKAAELGLSEQDLQAGIQLISNLAPKQERKGMMFEEDINANIEKLIDALTKEGALRR